MKGSIELTDEDLDRIADRVFKRMNERMKLNGSIPTIRSTRLAPSWSTKDGFGWRPVGWIADADSEDRSVKGRTIPPPGRDRRVGGIL